MISVCIATFNGALYIEEQLGSILHQLEAGDEVIVVDDSSSDATLELVKAFCDPRIKIYRNDANCGVLKTFERAISLSSGDLIFLSDQDDVWHLEKVARFVGKFNLHSEVTLLLSDARVIDEKGDVVCASYFQRRGRFIEGVVANIFKNKYLGCVMAFRRSLVNKMLPFPSNTPQHDMWIGLICAIYGKADFISMPLVDYRRHQGNASNTTVGKRASISKMIMWRWRLIKNLVVRIWSLRAAFVEGSR